MVGVGVGELAEAEMESQRPASLPVDLHIQSSCLLQKKEELLNKAQSVDCADVFSAKTEDSNIIKGNIIISNNKCFVKFFIMVKLAILFDIPILSCQFCTCLLLGRKFYL